MADTTQPLITPSNSQPVGQTGFPQVYNYGGVNDPSATTIERQGMTPELERNQVQIIYGDSGTMRYGGFYKEEFNTDWRDEARIDNVEQMRRGDATCAEALRALKAPLLSTTWNVEVESEDPKDIEIRDFVRQNIFEMEKRTWKDLLREMLTYFDFGFAVFEKVWEKREDGKIWLKDLAPRIQHSILRFQLNDYQKGVWQLVNTDEATNVVAQIPWRKCLILTNDKEGDDVTGMSVLRAAYKHWYYKQNLYNIAAVGAERYGVGIPVIWLPPTTGPQDKDEANKLVKNLRSNESSGIVFPSPDWKFEIHAPKGNAGGGETIKDQIEHHDRAILASILAQFLQLGTTDTGSFALSKDQHSFFLKEVEQKALYLAEEVSRQVIKDLVDYNFGEVETYPKLTFTPLGDTDYSITAQWIGTLSTAGLIKQDAKFTQWIHDTFKLPPLTDDDMLQLQQAEIDNELMAIDKDVQGTQQEQSMYEGNRSALEEQPEEPEEVGEPEEEQQPQPTK